MDEQINQTKPTDMTPVLGYSIYIEKCHGRKWVSWCTLDLPFIL